MPSWHDEAVNDAAVVARGRGGHDIDLVGFVTLQKAQGVDAVQALSDTEDQLRRWLQTKLPSYMLPTVIKALESMPRNANGKADRRILEELSRKCYSE